MKLQNNKIKQKMKSKYKLVLLGLLIIVIGCSGEVENIDLPIDEKVGRTIKFSATVADESLSTRMTMEQDGLDVKFKWEVGDEIKLLYTDGEQFANSVTIVTAVSNDGRTAQFELLLPGPTDSTTFDLYGFYGGGSLAAINTGDIGYVNLPSLPWGGSQSLVEDNIMLRFEATEIDVNNPEISVVFRHVGSLFKIFLENTSSITLSDITSVEIYSEDGSEIYAHQSNGSTAAQYDIINDEFVDGTTVFNNQLSFVTSDNLNTGEVLELWGWYPPSQETGHNWPALKLRVQHSGGPTETIDTKGAKTATTAIGRAYHFYAIFNGTNLEFSDIVKLNLVDSRDQSRYNFVQIGSQEWMAENLKFYPQNDTISFPSFGSATNPHYYVYNYNENLNDAEALQTFILGGTLYNWAAAFAGDAGSDTNPSGVRGICPEGWHLPSEAEWNQLRTFLVSDVCTKLKDPLWWTEDSSVSAGTNTSGFTARPSGIRESGSPYYSGLLTDGYWLLADYVGPNEMRVATIRHNESGIFFSNIPKEHAVSVRCVKD